MTWLGFLNYYLLQWFCVRLARCSETVKENLDVKFGMPDDYDAFIRNEIKAVCSWTETYYKWWGIHCFPLPLTGWNSDYKYIGKPFTKRITKIKKDVATKL